MKEATTLSIGDRNLPLEANIDSGANRDHDLVGRTAEVSAIAGGDLLGRSGTNAKILGVIERFGVIVGYEVEINGASYFGSAKDFYINRQYLEDIQPPTATSASLRDGLTHWSSQRDYWAEQIDGLEALCFALASVTPQALPECYPWGWRFLVPSPMPGDRVAVGCYAPLHGNFWSLSVSVYPERLPIEADITFIEDHWSRVFSWAHYIASAMCAYGYPWEKAVASLRLRADATSKILRPLVNHYLKACLAAKVELTGEREVIPPNSLSVAFSNVRLKAGTIGLLEPPTDRRPYSVMSVSPSAARDPEYLRQVVLHECIHLVVGSKGGDPHNDLFQAFSEKLGLKPEHRD